MLPGLEGLLEIVNCDLVELEILLEVLLEVSLEVLEARPRRRQSIGNASRAKRRISSHGKSRLHSVAKKVAARVGIRVDRRIERRGKGIGGHQGSCVLNERREMSSCASRERESYEECERKANARMEADQFENPQSRFSIPPVA